VRQPGCAFCDLVAGERPAHWVVDEGPVRAFLDHRPLFAGHTLVIPADHVEDLNHLDDELAVPVWRTVRAVSRALMAEEGLDAAGTFTATNTVVSQSVPHLHVHVVPRRRKDGLRGFFWPRTKYGSEEDMAATAARLRSAVIL
jgi:histidine triad (HIT) family protein